MKTGKIVTALAAATVAGLALAAKMPLPDARAQISACISNPAKMSETVKQLSAEDQVAFLSEVNEAISKMPGSNEAKAAKFLNVNRAAVSSAGKKNKKAVIAEVFATVPLEALTVINERFASDLLHMNADPSHKISPERFERIAQDVMKAVNARCASAENAAVRSTFAILMLIRASDNAIPGLADALVKTLPENVQNDARTEWLPAALGLNQPKTYEPLLGFADTTGDMLTNDVVIRLAGPQLLEALLGDLVEGTPMVNSSNDPDIYGTGIREGEIAPQPPAHPEKEPREPGGYQGQTI